MGNKNVNIFTEKDLENLDIERINKEGLKNLYSKGKSQWWNIGFRFWLKGDQRRFVGINWRKDEGYILKSDEYGEFKVSFLGKILADLINDNDELYIINRELVEVADKWQMEFGVRKGYITDERFAELIRNRCEWGEICRKFLQMAINGEKFITVSASKAECADFIVEGEDDDEEDENENWR